MDFRQLASDSESLQKFQHESHQATIYTALPGIVQTFNASAVTVTVQPTIRGEITNPDGTRFLASLPILPDVPVCWPRGGGYTLTFPVSPGDECLIVFSSRCIDSWWQLGGVQNPTDSRMHDLSDGFAIIGPFSQATKLAGISLVGPELRSNDGAVSVGINNAAGSVTLKAPTLVMIDAPNAQFTHNVHVLGNMIVDGTTTDGTIGLTTHHHVSGGGTGTNTGGPIG